MPSLLCFQKNANFVREPKLSPVKKFQRSRAKKYKDDWNQKPIINPDNEIINLKSDSHVPENICQIKIFPSHVSKNTIICLFGV